MCNSPALLVLASGKVFSAQSFAHPTKALGELCFNTSMTGYQEMLTDPSYKQQLLTLSYPMIGNYGINEEESESSRMQIAGLIVKEYVGKPSNYNSQKTLANFLIEHKKPAIQSLDTRSLIRLLREEGAQNGGIFPSDEYKQEMLEEVRAFSSMDGLDLASEAGTQSFYIYGEQENKAYRLAVLDFGIKKSILKFLSQVGFAVNVFPAKTPICELQKGNFDAFFVSNGPGDPGALGYAIKNMQKLIEWGKPIFGICLGHQLLSLAQGASHFKLKYGHRGANQPVLREYSGKVEITSQNHGFAIEMGNISGMSLTHKNLNDNTVEGFQSDSNTPILSVQYHPEASPGPQDSRYLFHEFFKMVERHAKK